MLASGKRCRVFFFPRGRSARLYCTTSMNSAPVSWTITPESVVLVDPYQVELGFAIAKIIMLAGFDSIEQVALQALVEHCVSSMRSIGDCARIAMENSGRVIATSHDIKFAIKRKKISLNELLSYYKRLLTIEDNLKVSIPRQVATPVAPIQNARLSACFKLNETKRFVRKRNNDVIPDYLPAFPQPHTYGKTPLIIQSRSCLSAFEKLHQTAEEKKNAGDKLEKLILSTKTNKVELGIVALTNGQTGRVRTWESAGFLAFEVGNQPSPCFALSRRHHNARNLSDVFPDRRLNKQMTHQSVAVKASAGMRSSQEMEKMARLFEEKLDDFVYPVPRFSKDDSYPSNSCQESEFVEDHAEVSSTTDNLVKLAIPLPTKQHRARRETARELGGVSAHRLPSLPALPETFVTESHVEERAEVLEEYMNIVLNDPLFREHADVLDFLEVSGLSFVEELGGKGKEGLVQKRPWETRREANVCYRCACMCVDVTSPAWRHRWLIVKDTWLGYLQPSTGKVHAIMLFDQGFEVGRGIRQTQVPHGLIISNLSRSLVIRCWTKRKMNEWRDEILKMAKSKGKEFIESQRYSSYAPLRENTYASWFVDGAPYMEAVAYALESATEEIYIADWWLTPEIYLKRPMFEGEAWRLDVVLERKAEQGVKIFVMLYKEVELALGINSWYSKKRLLAKHANIKVVRHPDHLSGGTIYWAHHEKLVIIDQKIAFVGGIDLCYGRWDDAKHKLIDLGSVGSGGGGDHRGLWRGLFMPPTTLTSSSAPRGALPSTIFQLAKATHQVSVSTLKTNGVDVVDTENRVETIVVQNPDDVPVEPEVPNVGGDDDVDSIADDSSERVKGDTPPPDRQSSLASSVRALRQAFSTGKEWRNKIALKWRRGRFEKISTWVIQTDFSVTLVVEETVAVQSVEMVNMAFTPSGDEVDLRKSLLGSSKLWMGKDYANFIVKDFSNLDSPYKDLVDRTTTPRMPWHDIATMVQGKAARDVARHFIQRWNAAKVDFFGICIEKFSKNDEYPFLLPKSYDNLGDDPISIPKLKAPVFNVKCQVLRSASEWSVGVELEEQSIHEAYRATILNAKHYIYVENQFFVSTGTGASPGTENLIAESIFERVWKAFKDGEEFRVFVVMPLLPGFEGQVGTPGGTAIQVITHWNYASMSRGSYSLLQKLRDKGVESPENYVGFFGLRTHAELNGVPVTELIYVHSKLLIVDDRVVICGSANINDRSMLGTRDSEVAVIIEDGEMIEGVMNGVEVQVSKYASSLRKQLFKEHLGLLPEQNETNSSAVMREDYDVSDPIAAEFWNNVWLATAENNTRIYEKTFSVMPTDKAKSFAALKEMQRTVPLAISDMDTAREVLKGIRGYLVQMPHAFLEEECLQPDVGSKEYLIPTAVWT
ncbi:unnamed protein product [Notodromas monacha]|uniref:phospholipase D n=1 Tax=Notodromas monacha TaxID=399045 RepID=A0A7R9GAV9_9CRUS|nr:unnamed protein product [Notodromas monacha]CAG0914405.1 unnamed protein product [Notodromas monacha]